MANDNTAGHVARMVTQWKHKTFDRTDSKEDIYQTETWIENSIEFGLREMYV